MTTTDYTRTWTQVGAADVIGKRLEGGGRVTRPAVERAIEALSWIDVPESDELSLSMIPGEGIKAAIKELRIPKVTQIAISHDLAPYGLYAIEGNYKNGRAVVYVVDLGSNLIPVASDFYPKEG